MCSLCYIVYSSPIGLIYLKYDAVYKSVFVFRLPSSRSDTNISHSQIMSTQIRTALNDSIHVHDVLNSLRVCLSPRAVLTHVTGAQLHCALCSLLPHLNEPYFEFLRILSGGAPSAVNAWRDLTVSRPVAIWARGVSYMSGRRQWIQ